MKVLVVDDEKLLVKGIKFNLENDGYEVLTGADGVEAVEIAAKEAVDLVVLDLMMPRMDGLEACQKIREFSDVPIIMLTAKADDMDKLLGFEHGADDYLTKPFNILELKARIRALLRRSGGPAAPVEYTVGPLYVSPARHVVRVNGRDVTLTLKEYEVLKMLLENQDVVLTRDRLLNQVWGYSFDGESRTVDVHIRTLRQKLMEAGELIETVRGVGYKIGVRP